MVTPLSLIVIFALTILGVSLFYLALQDISSTSREVLREKALLAVEGGVNDYLWHLNQNEDYYYKETTHLAQIDWVKETNGEHKLKVTPLSVAPGVIIETFGQASKTTSDGTLTV